MGGRVVSRVWASLRGLVVQAKKREEGIGVGVRDCDGEYTRS